MTIQRQYSLANCKLVLEGWEDTTGAVSVVPGRPLLSMITGMECHFSGYEQPLTGGQELLDNLLHAVSRYTQEILSGVAHPAPAPTKSAARVQLQSLGSDRHQLTVNQAASEDNPSKYQVELTTTQLFDLVEAMDQLVADVQTLPQLAVDLSPVPKRFVATQESVSEKLLPATLGLSSLAVAAIALFLLPVPEVTIPEVEPRPLTEEQVLNLESDGTGTGNDDGASSTGPDEDEDEPDAADNADPDTTSAETEDNAVAAIDADAVDDADAGDDADAVDDADATDAVGDGDAVDDNDAVDDVETTGNDRVGAADEDPAVERPLAEEIDDILAAAQPIADPDVLADLTQSLRQRVDRAWDGPGDMPQDVVYRVGVAENGALIGFTPVNDQGFADASDNPLDELEAVPLDVATDLRNAVGQFRVVFRTSGVIEVSPWYGRLPE